MQTARGKIGILRMNVVWRVCVCVHRRWDTYRFVSFDFYTYLCKMPTQFTSNVHIFVVGSIFIPDEKRVHRIQVRVTRTVQKTKHAIDMCSKNPSSGLSTTFAFHKCVVHAFVCSHTRSLTLLYYHFKTNKKGIKNMQ